MPARTRTVQWQILARQLPLLILLFLCVLYWLGSDLEGMLLSANLDSARRSSLGVVYAVEASMLADRDHAVWDRVVEKIPRDEQTSIEIIDTHGLVVFSTDETRRGTTHRLTDPLCARCHENGSTEAAARNIFFRDPDNRDYQVLASSLGNTAACRSCHANDGEKLGMVLVRQTLEPIQEQVRAIQIKLALVGLVILVLTMFTFRLLLERYLGGPLNRLVLGARAIGAGNLRRKIELPEPNELTVLAETLNASSAKLEKTVRQLEQQRDDFSTLYRLVDQLSRSVKPKDRRCRAVELAEKILGARCLLVRSEGPSEGKGSDSVVTFRNGAGIVEQSVPVQGEALSAPAPFSGKTIEGWKRGEFDGRAEVREGNAVAYPLQRSGQRLGLLLRLRQPYDDVPASDAAPDPEMVQALCKHLAIALEFSDFQRELVEEERLAAVGETVAGLAHWLKNTLNGLRAGQYVIDRAVEQEDMEKLHRGWAVMKKSVRQVEKLTADVLYCVKERSPEREPADPNQIVRDVVEALTEKAAAQGVSLRVDLDEETDTVTLDRESIHRALLNLVTNAIDACADSGSGDTVTVRSRLLNEEFVLMVEDNGIGIPEAMRRNLFKRFYSTKGSKGTGLGLMVVQKIAEEHGGRVEVKSEYRKGSVFAIHLPRGADSGAVSSG